jgi:hypothetical protein
LKTFKSVRGYAIVDFKCFNYQGLEDRSIKMHREFTRHCNLGRLEFTTYQEFYRHFVHKFMESFRGANSKYDYVLAYGVGEIELNILQYNPFFFFFLRKSGFFKLVKQEINNLLQFLAPSSAGWANGRET